MVGVLNKSRGGAQTRKYVGANHHALLTNMFDSTRLVCSSALPACSTCTCQWAKVVFVATRLDSLISHTF